MSAPSVAAPCLSEKIFDSEQADQIAAALATQAIELQDLDLFEDPAAREKLRAIISCTQRNLIPLSYLTTQLRIIQPRLKKTENIIRAINNLLQTSRITTKLPSEIRRFTPGPE